MGNDYRQNLLCTADFALKNRRYSTARREPPNKGTDILFNNRAAVLLIGSNYVCSLTNLLIENRI